MRSNQKIERITVKIVILIFLISSILLLRRILKDTQELREQANEISYTASSQSAWVAFNGGGSRNGVNSFEKIITAQNVSLLKKQWQISMPDNSRGTLVAAAGVPTQQGVKDLIFVTTRHGSLLAYDITNGNLLWRKDTQGNYIAGQGTTSSPAIDPSLQFIYSYGLDGTVHKYNITNGNEITTGGFPIQVTRRTDVEKGSSPLNIGNGYLYMTMSGYDGDFGPYVGHIVGVNLATGSQSVFNALCSNVNQIINGNCQYNPQNSGAGVWGRGGGVIDPQTHNVFLASGNGTYDGTGTNYGDSIIELTPDLSKVVDSYTPAGYNGLQQSDTDLGSTSPAFIGNNLLIQGGKDSTIRVLNSTNLSGQRGPNHTGGELHTHAVSNQILSQPAVWTDQNNQTWVYVTDQSNDLYIYQVINNDLTQPIHISGAGHTSPLLANGVLYLQSNNKITAYNPTTGTLLWSSQLGGDYWESPLVFNGHVYTIDDANNLTAFGLTGITSTPLPTPTTPTSPTNTPTPTFSPSITPSPTAITPSPTVAPTVFPTPSPQYFCGNSCNDNSQCNSDASGGCGVCDIFGTHTCVASLSITSTPTVPITPSTSITPSLSLSPIPSVTESPSPTPQLSPIPFGETPTPSPGPALGSIAVHFEGIDSSNNHVPNHPQRQVVLSFYKTQDFSKYPEDLISIPVSFSQQDSTGSFINSHIQFLAIPPGSYYILVKSPEGSLREEVSPNLISISKGLTISLNGSQALNLRMGDLNNHNTVDLTDYNILSDCYGKKAFGQACKNHGLSDFAKGLFADINDDGIVDGVDYNILLRHFGETGY